MTRFDQSGFQILAVPSRFATITDALNYCKRQITDYGDERFFQIKIADGVYYFDQIEIDFFSDKVEIIGNVAHPENVQLHFSSLDNRCGFLLQRGNGIFKIDGVTINGHGGFLGYGQWADES